MGDFEHVRVEVIVSSTPDGVRVMVVRAVSTALGPLRMRCGLVPVRIDSACLDPIDNSIAAAANGRSASSISRPASRSLRSVRDSTQVTGWLYRLTARGAGAEATPTTLATDVENFAIDRARTTLAYSLSSSAGPDAGVWVTPL